MKIKIAITKYSEIFNMCDRVLKVNNMFKVKNEDI